jgi:hypothetical protein
MAFAANFAARVTALAATPAVFAVAPMAGRLAARPRS